MLDDFWLMFIAASQATPTHHASLSVASRRVTTCPCSSRPVAYSVVALPEDSPVSAI